MKNNGRFLALAGLLAIVTTGFLLAQDQPAAAPAGTDRKADETAIRERAQALAQAFEKGDAKTVAAFWTEEGEYVDDEGRQLNGRAALEKAYAEFFAKRQEVKAEAKTDKVRFLGKDLAVEEGTFTVRAKDSPAQASRYSTLYVRQDGRWQVAMLKEWSDETTAAPNLQDLAWLIGTWESEGGEAKARTTYAWSDNNKVIRAQYTVEVNEGGKKTTHTGTQIITVDPALNVIRASTFDSDGSVGEAHWHYDGTHWVIDAGGSLADGSRLTALNFITRSGDDAFTWRSTKRTQDGENMPDLAPVKVNRIKAGN